MARQRKRIGPKQNLSAYLHFLNERRPVLKASGFGMKEIMKRASLEWRVLEDKSRWQALARADRARYQREKTLFWTVLRLQLEQITANQDIKQEPESN